MSNTKAAAKLQEKYRISPPEEKARDFMAMLHHLAETDPESKWAHLYNIALQLNIKGRAELFDYMFTLATEQETDT